jgi:hypothetical protein
MTGQDFEFDADFMCWLASQDPRYLDFMFRMWRELLQLNENGAGPKPPEPVTGKRLRVRFFRTPEEFKAAKDHFDNVASLKPITDEEIKQVEQALDRDFHIGPSEQA